MGSVAAVVAQGAVPHVFRTMWASTARAPCVLCVLREPCWQEPYWTSRIMTSRYSNPKPTWCFLSAQPALCTVDAFSASWRSVHLFAVFPRIHEVTSTSTTTFLYCKQCCWSLRHVKAFAYLTMSETKLLTRTGCRSPWYTTRLTTR